MFECCICGRSFEGFGNNPYPVNTDENARCCDECNWGQVIPARLNQLMGDSDIDDIQF